MISISPSNILKRYHQNSQVFLAATGMNGLIKASHVTSDLNPSNAEATYVQSTRTQRFLKPSKPCHIGIY